MISLLQEYMRINTSHPHPDYTAVGVLFARQAAQDGLQFQEIVLPPGYPVYCITAQGSDISLPALALTHHMDVVCADEEGWEYPPFSATIAKDILIGRGAQDCKGLGVVHYAALVRAQAEKKLVRTVHLLFLPHEEVGGFLGAGQLILTAAFQQLRIGLVLDEGSASGQDATILIKVSERKPLQILLKSTGPAGHAAHTNAQNCIHTLLTCIVDCQRAITEYNKHSEHVTSCHVTSIQAGSVHAHNVIPACAQATLDIRVAAYHKSAEISALIHQIIAQYPGITLEICAQVFDAPIGNFTTSFVYNKIATRIETQGFTVVPMHFEASSDLRWYQSIGIEGYGITPFTGRDSKHQVNEHLAYADFEQGTMILYEIIKELCYKGVKND